MRNHGFRVWVASCTFIVGLSVASALQLLPQVEDALAARFFNVRNTVPDAIEPIILDSAEDANEIYRVLIQQEFKRNPRVKIVLLHAETAGFEMYEDEAWRKKYERGESFQQAAQELLPEAEPQMLDDYLAKNKTPGQVEISNPGVNYALIKNNDFPDRIDRFWGAIYAKYPTPVVIMSFSKVGFNYRHDQAFVYVGSVCGGLCGTGEYVLLKKVGNKWVVRQSQHLWVS